MWGHHLILKLILLSMIWWIIRYFCPPKYPPFVWHAEPSQRNFWTNVDKLGKLSGKEHPMLKFQIVLLASSFLLTACMTTEPTAPTPQRQQLINACESGDLDACKFLETSDANARAQKAAAWSALGQQQAAQRTSVADAYWGPQRTLNSGRTQPVTTRCQNVLGQIVCQTN